MAGEQAGLRHRDVGRVVGAEYERFEPGARRVGGQRGAGIAGGRHGDARYPERLGHRHRDRQAARLERAGRQPALVLDQQRAAA
jgi:hypothetical protein